MKPTTHYFRQNLGGILYLLDDPIIHYFKDSLMGKPTIVVGWWPNVWSIPTLLIPLSFQIMAIVDQHQPTHMWPKNNVKHFQWMKAENPNLALWLNCWRHGVSSAPKNLFSCFFIFSLFFLFCRLLWRDPAELISVMEHDHGYSMETRYETCESWLCKGIGEEISREQKDKKKKYIYEAN
jgi:hypothetical protein